MASRRTFLFLIYFRLAVIAVNLPLALLIDNKSFFTQPAILNRIIFYHPILKNFKVLNLCFKELFFPYFIAVFKQS